MTLYNKKEKIKKECLNCSKEFEVLPSRNKRKFCCLLCSIQYYKGKKRVGNYKANSGSFKKGQKSHNKGVSPSKETREKMRLAKLKNPTKYWLGKKRLDMTGKKNCNWKGDEASYQPKHSWIKRKKGKASDYTCEICGIKQAQDWSNKDHLYKRKLEYWWPLCKSCHKKYDNKMKKNKEH